MSIVELAKFKVLVKNSRGVSTAKNIARTVRLTETHSLYHPVLNLLPAVCTSAVVVVRYGSTCPWLPGRDK